MQKKIIVQFSKVDDTKIREIFQKHAVNDMSDFWFRKPYFVATCEYNNKRMYFWPDFPNEMKKWYYDAWGMMYNSLTGDIKILFQGREQYYYDALRKAYGLDSDVLKYAFFLSKDNLKRVREAEKYPFEGFHATVGMEQNTYLKDFNPSNEQLRNLSVFSCHFWRNEDNCFGHVFDFANVFVLADENGKLCCPEDLKNYVFLPYMAD